MKMGGDDGGTPNLSNNSSLRIGFGLEPGNKMLAHGDEQNMGKNQTNGAWWTLTQ
jgi:hypothetical protein